MNNKVLVSIKVLSEKLDLKTSWIRDHLSEIPHYKMHRLVRFDLNEVKSWLSKFRAGGLDEQ